MPIRAVIVDVDGVLVDGRPEDGRHWSSGLEEDLGISKDVLDREFFRVHWEDIVLGRAALEVRLAPVFEKFCPYIAVDEFISYWFRKDSRIMGPLLQELALIRATGIKIYLATNQEHRRAMYLMEDMGLKALCDGMYYSAQLSVSKPNPQFFARVSLLTGLGAHELILIDDTLANVKAASALGWKTIHWTRGSSPEVLWDAIK